MIGNPVMHLQSYTNTAIARYSKVSKDITRNSSPSTESDPMQNYILNRDWSNSVPGRQFPKKPVTVPMQRLGGVRSHVQFGRYPQFFLWLVIVAQFNLIRKYS